MSHWDDFLRYALKDPLRRARKNSVRPASQGLGTSASSSASGRGEPPGRVRTRTLFKTNHLHGSTYGPAGLGAFRTWSLTCTFRRITYSLKLERFTFPPYPRQCENTTWLDEPESPKLVRMRCDLPPGHGGLHLAECEGQILHWS